MNFFFLINLVVLCSCGRPPAFVKRDTTNYSYLYDTNIIKVNSLWSYALNENEHNYIHSTCFDNIVLTIIDFKMENVIKTDSIYIDTTNQDDDLTINSSRLMVYGYPYEYLSFIQNYDFGNHIKVKFSDLNEIDTVFRSSNCVGFVTRKGSKFGFFDDDDDLKMAVNDIDYKSSLNVLYTKDNRFYFIQIKSQILSDINYNYLHLLKLD